MDGKPLTWMITRAASNLVGSRRRFGSGVPVGHCDAAAPCPSASDHIGERNFLAASRVGSRFYIPQGVEQAESDVIYVRMGWAK